jgi:hypothetical protein
MKIKKYRFFYHYNKIHNKITIHFKNRCILVKNLICKVPVESKWNDKQPRLIIRGFCENVKIKENIGYIL